MASHGEYRLQVAICKFLQMQYPDVVFLSDTVANIKLTQPQATRNKAIQKRDFSCPDLIILEPRGKYHGLFLELKIASPFRLDGGLKKQVVKVKDTSGRITEVYDHLEEQSRALRVLSQKGYRAEFCWDLDMAVRIIREYMNAVH